MMAEDSEQEASIVPSTVPPTVPSTTAMADSHHQTPDNRNYNNTIVESSTPGVMTIQRQVYTHDSLNRVYALEQTPRSSLSDVIRSRCTCTNIGHALLGYFPLFDVIRRYKIRSDLMADFMSGLSVAFLQLPQGLALGLLADLPAVYGLYTTFFTAMLYMVFGTSRHSSVGTNALISLLTASIIATEMDRRKTGTHSTAVPANMSDVTTSATPVGFETEEEVLAFKVGVASAVAFLVGIYLTVAGLLKFGFVTNYFSPSFIGGFTTAAAFHILTSQVSKMLHIKIKPPSGIGKVVITYVEIFKNIEKSNPADVIISVISVAFLLYIAIGINQRYKHKLPVPVPAQLILVAIATVVSHFGELERRFDVAAVGDIPLGLPSPSLPEMEVIPDVASEAVVVAVLVFTISIALAKLAAKTHNYSIDDNQEFVAYGATNLISSFFSCFTSCNAPPRVMILSSVGAKSTINALFCSVFILVALLVAGPLFVSLPIAVLAAMICVAMKDLLLQVTDLPFLWRTSKPDFIIWVVSCGVSVFTDLHIGIIVGIAVSIFTVVVETQLVSGTIGSISFSEDLIHKNGIRAGVSSSTHFIIFYFPAILYFANTEKFKSEMFSKVIDPDELNPDASSVEIKLNRMSNNLRYVILDCSAITYMDLPGANMIKGLAILYHKRGVTLLLANCPDKSLRLLGKIRYFEEISRDTVYYDVYDAVHFIQEKIKSPEPRVVVKEYGHY